MIVRRRRNCGCLQPAITTAGQRRSAAHGAGGSGNCGDDPGLAYCEIPSGLQWLRGPRPIAAAWAAYERHLGVGLTG
jgi:hypothetical protein